MLKNLFQQRSFEDTIVSSGIISQDEYDSIVQDKETDQSEEQAIINHFASDVEKFRQIAQVLNVEVIPLLELPKIPQAVIEEIPRGLVSEYKIFPFDYDNGDTSTIKVATDRPSDSDISETLELRLGKDIKMYLASMFEIDQMISRYYGDAAALEAADAYASSIADTNTGPRRDDILGDSPIITIVNSILDQAARLKASDIHIEPFEEKLRIRYRIDGALVERPSYSMKMHSAIIARLKIMGGMDIAEKRIPQDGRITFRVDKVEYDIRVSMLPTVYGEKCVMRLAIRENLQRNKKDLGLTEYDLKIFDKVFSNPNGIILVTGPTGSGKSTTLYTALNELSTEEVNVITVEDPVEANVDGVNQVQTNARAGLTFAAALRSILRQDPDIIMIGEIRDGETAGIAVQSAITGHLVVSTLHTNSSAASISRLVNMGIEPYLVADSVVGIMAQRLVRKLCPRCKKPHIATTEELKELGIREEINGVKTKLEIYEKGGCAYCNNTGFAGRTAVYEIMDVVPSIKRLIVKNASTEEIRDEAIRNGMHTLHRSAAELVAKGITTMSEMRKVSNDI